MQRNKLCTGRTVDEIPHPRERNNSGEKFGCGNGGSSGRLHLGGTREVCTKCGLYILQYMIKFLIMNQPAEGR